MSLLTDAIIALIPLIVVTAAGAIYLNRRRSNKLYQRLFGLDDDPADVGYIPQMSEKMDNISENVEELNHRRITDIEDRMDGLDDRLGEIQRHLREYPDEDDD